MPSEATSSSWNSKPFVEGVSLQYRAQFTQDQFNRIVLGLIPQEMEDKWFIYFVEPYLFLHRSWTGEPVYRLSLELGPEFAEVAECMLEKKWIGQLHIDLDHHAALVDFIVSNLLLGMTKPFPVPDQIDEPGRSVYQHSVSGTAYKEISSTRPWWKFW